MQRAEAQTFTLERRCRVGFGDGFGEGGRLKGGYRRRDAGEMR